MLLFLLILSIVNYKKKNDLKSFAICFILGIIIILVFIFFKDSFTISNIVDEVIKFFKDIGNKVAGN